MANLLLGVTGSVAAIYTKELVADLKNAGHAVKVVATRASLYFFDPLTLDPASGERNRDLVILDEDEWPGDLYQRGDAVMHIELRRWADLLLIAPLDANTLAKLAFGLSDNCLTCVYRAWDRSRPVVLAPAMNTLMWDSPTTLRHLRLLAEDMPRLPLDDSVRWINEHEPLLHLVAPVSKRLACDDVGVGALAPRDAILAAVSMGLS